MITNEDEERLLKRMSDKFKTKDDCDNDMDELIKDIHENARWRERIDTKMTGMLWFGGLIVSGLVALLLEKFFGV